MEIQEEQQRAPVGDPVSALVAVTRPIIAGVLQSIGREYLDEYDGDKSRIPLKMLGKLRSEGDGDCGIAFEYAIHQAVREKNEVVLDRVSTALATCRINRGEPGSILFAVEKQGSKQLIQTDIDLITSESRVLSGKRGNPVKLKGQMNVLAAAFRRPSTRLNLPQSIRGLWKADLFLGSSEPDRWVGTSVKINRSHVESAPGLRIAIVPTSSGKSDAVRRDENKNIVVCPIPHDGAFMEVFYEGWRVVQALCHSNFKLPNEATLPTPREREVARIYVDRREFPVEQVLDATASFAQPHLLATDREQVTTRILHESLSAPATNTVISPMPIK